MHHWFSVRRHEQHILPKGSAARVDAIPGGTFIRYALSTGPRRLALLLRPENGSPIFRHRVSYAEPAVAVFATNTAWSLPEGSEGSEKSLRFAPSTGLRSDTRARCSLLLMARHRAVLIARRSALRAGKTMRTRLPIDSHGYLPS